MQDGRLVPYQRGSHAADARTLESAGGFHAFKLVSISRWSTMGCTADGAATSFALCKHPRNVPDNVLTLLKQNNGIIMVTFVDKFVHEDPKEAGMEHVVDHIMHAASMIGFDHIGIGSDYDGTLRLAKGLEDTSCFPALVDCMLKRGIPKGDIKKILGLNLVRVLKEVEDYARSSTLQVLEDEVELWVT